MVSTTARGRVLFCAAVLGAMCLAAPARAGFVHLRATTDPGESNHVDILAHRYGGSFHATGQGGLDFTNGLVTARRLDDAAGAFWRGGSFSATAVARFAGWQQSLGYLDGANGGAYHDLLVANGSGFNVNGSVNSAGAGIWQWARGGEGDVLPSLGGDGDDVQLVTYQIDGLGAGAPETWLLCWEDVAADASDRDYNDLVVEVTASPVGAPLPPAALPGLIALAGAGITAGFRKVRRAVL